MLMVRCHDEEEYAPVRTLSRVAWIVTVLVALLTARCCSCRTTPGTPR